MSADERTQMLLDILFPPAAQPGQEPVYDPADHPYCGTPETTDWEADVKIVSFTYRNQNGRINHWCVDVYGHAVFFTFRDFGYMLIRGERGGPVCFRLDRCMITDTLSLAQDAPSYDIRFLEADPDRFPTEDTQDWMLTNYLS